MSTIVLKMNSFTDILQNYYLNFQEFIEFLFEIFRKPVLTSVKAWRMACVM